MKKRLILVFGMLILLAIAGCAWDQPSLKLHWGDVKYEVRGEQKLGNLKVITPEGVKITVESAENAEYQATSALIGVAKDLAGKIPASE